MCRGEDKVTLEARIDDLNDDVFVCETNHEAIFGRVTESTVWKLVICVHERRLTTCFLPALLAACARNLAQNRYMDFMGEVE